MLTFTCHIKCYNHKCTAKFGGIVSGTVQTPNTKKTDESDLLKRFTIIDIVTYSISAVAGFLILIFIVVLICIACCCCYTRAKAYKRQSKRLYMIYQTPNLGSVSCCISCMGNNNKHFIGNALETNIYY